MVLQYKQEFQNMNHEKPLLCHVFQLKFGQVYSAYKMSLLFVDVRGGEMMFPDDNGDLEDDDDDDDDGDEGHCCSPQSIGELLGSWNTRN
jgi:hypothetical protein